MPYRVKSGLQCAAAGLRLTQIAPIAAQAGFVTEAVYLLIATRDLPGGGGGGPAGPRGCARADGERSASGSLSDSPVTWSRAQVDYLK